MGSPPWNHHGIRAPSNVPIQTVSAYGSVGPGEGDLAFGRVNEYPRHRRGPKRKTVLTWAAALLGHQEANRHLSGCMAEDSHKGCGETKEVCWSGTNMTVLGYSSLRGSAPHSLSTLSRTIWMPVATNVLPASRRESKKESQILLSRKDPEGRTRTAYIGHSKSRSSGTAAQAVYLIELRNQAQTHDSY
ncbi:hypothetical protein EDB85DRAFT_1899315 [Lactarius pseudohatsudake]|nr:hypothetical protein EDB85DRAFT_1899315 [Lactarius pseudohatsudake]